MIPRGFLDERSVCYLAGAGEDLSFDLELSGRYRCEIHIIDPTPRARVHFDLVKRGVASGQMSQAANPRFGGGDPSYWGKLGAAGACFPRLHFHEIALSDRCGKQSFFLPVNPDHVSCSLENLQETEAFIEVSVEDIESLMARLGHQGLDLLKLDIEGTEVRVLWDLLGKRILPRIVCVEFDGARLGRETEESAAKLTQALLAAGYALLHDDGRFNHTYAIAAEW